MGEFNVNKSDGSLEQTAGMPSEYPATQVMMSDGLTSVEDALDALTDRVDANTVGADTSVKGLSDYNITSDGYLRFVNNDSSSGLAQIQIGGQYVFRKQYNFMSNTEVYVVFVKKGMTLTDTSTLNSYYLNFNPIS